MKIMKLAFFVGVGIVSISTSLLSTGCGSTLSLAPSEKLDARFAVLARSIEPLKTDFNSDTSKPRLLAIFSPTCGGCIYGATALQHEAKKLAGPGYHIKVLVVWAAM